MGSFMMDSLKKKKDTVHVEHTPKDDKAVLGVAELPAEFAHLDEKKILRKVIANQPRGNIGNANIEGLSEDLRLTPDQYNWCLTVFFFTYAFFEVPSNLMLKKLRPSRWLPSIMVAWGLVTTLMGIVRNYHGLLVARIFLGVAEAGLFPGVALRQAMFFSAASVAGAFSGLLAFAISKMHGVGGLEGWRWIFILEGLVTIVVAVVSFFTLYDFPETAGFLTEDERAFVVYRLKYQGQVTSTTSDGGPATARVAQSEEFQWKYVWQAFTDWQIYVNTFVSWGVVCPLYGISLFLPTIIKDLGYQKSTAQLMTIPIYITASVLAVFSAFFSDRVGMRSPFIVTLLCGMAAGFGMCIGSSDPKVVYGGVFFAACCIYPAFPGVITWLSNNLAGSYKRNVGMALQVGIVNLGGAMAANFYRKKDKPRFILGHALELGFIGLGIVAAVSLVVTYRRINDKRDRQMREGAERLHTAEELAAMGDRAVTFRYMY
ncbi:putative transporter C11D3.18C [Beauveria bassiana]|nr:putative transporter C11D3.18C [Beauveria bassiana]